MTESGSSELISATFLSLRVAGMAVVLDALVAVPLAYILARRRFLGKAVVETVVMLPLILPPTVVGYGLMMVFGVEGVLGRPIYQLTHFRFLFSTTAAVVAAAIVAFPLLLIPSRAAFAAIDRELIEVARLLGASPVHIFFQLSLPLAVRGIAAGLLLAFARALGELGATIMVLGDVEGHRTLPISVYFQVVESGNLHKALPAVLLLSAASLILTVFYSRSRLLRPQ
jgi:molybdate transport system permease protein